MANNVKTLSQKINDISAKIDRNQKALDQIDDVARILRENEQNLKDLGTLKSRLDLLDKIYIKIDKIADPVDRIGKVEKHLHLTVTP